MNENRENTRYQSSAKVRIKETGEEDFLLKDLSVAGCRIECPIDQGIMPNKQFTLLIFPESGTEISSFAIDVESKWVRVGGSTCESGFLIIKPPKGKQFQSYVDYLAWQYSQGEK